jgi:hypothetical protein
MPGRATGPHCEPLLLSTAYELAWAALSNGELLAAAENDFDVLVTTDRNLRHEQNLTGRRLSILVRGALSIAPGELRELTW